MLSLWQRALNGEAFSDIVCFNLDNSTTTNYEFHFTPLKDYYGHVIGASHIATNIDTRIQSQQMIDTDREKLKLLVKDLESKNNELYLLKELITMLNINEGIEQFVKIFTHYVKKIFPNTAGILYLCLDIDKELELESTWNSPRSTTRSLSFNECYGLLQNRTYVVNNNELACAHISNEKSSSYSCIPLLAREKKLGLLYIETLQQESAVSHQFMQLVAEQIALALYNLQLKCNLKALSIHDPLTNLYNRRYMDEYLAHEITIAKRYSKQFWILLIDIDYFKKINDTHGHQTGDYVIKKIANILKNHFRESDLICRWGGEEFLVLVKEISKESILSKSESLRNKIQKINFQNRDKKINITISIGIAEFKESQNKEDIIKNADDALYEAKNTGRNKTLIFSEKTS